MNTADANPSPSRHAPVHAHAGPEPRIPAAPATLLEPEGAHDTTLLIVDDVPANLALLMDVLQPHYRIRAATSGPRALQIAHGTPAPDLILLDVMMPEMDGFEVLARLRAEPATRGIPVIFVTAMEGTTDEEQGLNLGAVDYITKPLRPVIALARIRAQLELKRARDVLANQNTLLEAEVTRRMADNERIQDATIHALARLAEKRDNETGNHLRRTQEYVRALAQQLQSTDKYRDFLTDRAVAELSKSAPLHDIGKVAIPDHILRKAGPLTASEWETMRTHAQHGCHAIEQVEEDLNVTLEFLTYAKEITLCHHERWDGTGYPRRLVGVEIPLSARLMAVADVFDALISARVYKAAIDIEVARDMILAERGAQFDPDVVDAFAAVFPQFAAVAERFRDVDRT